MDIFTTQYERKDMSEKQKKIDKKNVLYLVLAGVALVFIVLVAYIVISANNSGATTEETGTTAKVSSSASSVSSTSTSKYVEGKDYTVKYSNDGVIDKASIDEALSYGGLNNYDLDITEKDANYSKFEFFYNQSKDVIVEKLYSVDNSSEPTSIVAYDLSKKQMIEGNIGRLYYDNQPLVYTWTNNTVK